MIRTNSHNSDNSIEIFLRRWITPPDSIQDMGRLAREDQRAAGDIHEAQEILQWLQEYRAALGRRAQEILARQQEPAQIRVTLERHREYTNKLVKYKLRITRLYSDGYEEPVSETTYPGKSRHEALAAYQAAVKAHPGCTATQAIQKHAWER